MRISELFNASKNLSYISPRCNLQHFLFSGRSERFKLLIALTILISGVHKIQQEFCQARQLNKGKLCVLYETKLLRTLPTWCYLRARCTWCLFLASRREWSGCVFRVNIALDDPVRAAGWGIQDLHARLHSRPETCSKCAISVNQILFIYVCNADWDCWKGMKH